MFVIRPNKYATLFGYLLYISACKLGPIDVGKWLNQVGLIFSQETPMHGVSIKSGRAAAHSPTLSTA